MTLKESLDLNLKTVKALIGDGDDVIFFEFSIGEKSATAIYVDSITDKAMLGIEVLSPLKRIGEMKTVKAMAKEITCANVQIKDDAYALADDVLKGNTVILFEGKKRAVSIDLKKFETRAINEPPTGFSIRGPRSGFVESIKVNLSLVRRHIKSKDIKIENSEVGRYTKTSISLIYLSGIAKDEVVSKIRKKLREIDIDGVPDSSYIAKYLSERKNSLFKQVGTTERPDVFMEKMLEGRVGILVDGSPFALTLPYLMIEDFQSAEDYYISTYRANASRAVRIIALLISILLPSFFVAAQLFHLQILPLNFLLTIINSIKGIPLSPSLEMFFIMLIFEILNETSVRMPKYVGMALGVVGALVLGETIVNAGIVSTPAVLIMALSGICIYTVPEIVETTSVMRLLFLLLAGSVGLFGIILLSAFMLLYLTTMDNYGVPYVAPYSPLISGDLQDGFQMINVIDMKKRPASLGSKNTYRRGKKNG